MYHTLSVEETLEKLNTTYSKGISNDEATIRLKKYGENALLEVKKEGLLVKFIKQFKDVLVLVLIAAAIVSFILGEKLDAYVIGIIVLVNASMGYIQEARAEKAIEALKKLSTDLSRVIRNGEIVEIEVQYLVPGDLILLEAGDKVPADSRIIEAVNLEVSEAILTGESFSVKKHSEKINTLNTPLGDRLNTLYKDTTVVYGRGKAIVVATGKDTEIGKISKMLQVEQKSETPLGKELNVVGKRLSLAAGVIILLMFGFSILFQKHTEEGFLLTALLTALSLAVAAIPEGLPAVVTIVLAVGVSRLAKHNSIIRRLQAVETLGSTNYILTDKTGTLTQNKMSVTNMYLKGKNYSIDSQGVLKDKNGNTVDTNSNENLLWALKVGVLCNGADTSKETNGKYTFLGDPTEVSILELAQNAGIDIKETNETYKRVFEIPFTSETKKMLVVVQDPTNKDKLYVCAKGAPEIMGQIVNEPTDWVLAAADAFAEEGLRNLALSYKELSLSEFELAKTLNNPEDILSTYHTFLGIMAQKDPLRPEVKDALLLAKKAGVQTLMLTGDHKLTAINIAKELGLIKENTEAMDGSELSSKNDTELLEILKRVKVFARVSPDQKLRIVNAIQSMGNIVAVTGDGVNDAPAIKAADIGISMGITGTDVSKEVSDMVLKDDNYATIVEAIKQGRVIYDNLVKFIKYLISCNMSEIGVVAIAIFLGYPLPLLPIHILWVNLVTDGFPALALGMEPPEADIMNRKPRNKNQGLLTTKRWVRMSLEALLITIGTLTAFIYTYKNYSLEIAETATLTTLAFSQLFHAFNNRSEIHSIFSRKLEMNKHLIFTFVASVIVQLGVVYTPIGNEFLKTFPLPRDLFLLTVLLAFIPVVGSEIYKIVMQKKLVENA